MQEDLKILMLDSGEVKQDLETTFFRILRKSRGWYIVLPLTGVWYLHHDGDVKNGVHNDSEKPAFWGSEEEAQSFFDSWKVKNKLTAI